MPAFLFLGNGGSAMSQQIAILPEKLCNQIAAGEVVERPSSVVKELLENSLDAGADQIAVEVERGGKKRIRVVDNGCGMGGEDIFLCFERHATSKIRSEEDLFHLQFHGFRGEALPSIAAVSRLTVTSRHQDDDVGMQIALAAGVIKHTQQVGSACGTTFEIVDLFYNVPARRKFLRQDETEFGHICEIVTRLALAHPAVHFTLIHNDRTVLDLYRQKCSLDRIAAVLGRNITKDLLPLDEGKWPLRLSGFLARPTVNRSTTTGIYSFVNGRFVKDRVIHHAIMDGYRQLLMKGRYPLCVLFLELDPEHVDVNVHPTKHEVRFHDQRTVHTFISATVREVLRSASPSLVLSRQPSAGMPITMPELEPESPPMVAAPSAQLLPRNTLHSVGNQPHSPALPQWSSPVESQVTEATEPYAVPSPQRLPADSATAAAVTSQPLLIQDGRGYFSSLTVIGQYHRSYLLCEDDDDLVLIDQHAAHERIGFERFRHQFASGGIEKQELLFPEILELSIREHAELAEHLEQLQRFGFELEPFGGNSWALMAVPTFLSESDAKTMVCDILAELVSVGSSALSQDAADAVLIKMACHGMIRANQRLSMVEMKALLEQLDDVDFNRHCPHGRPILQRLGAGEVEKMFRRS